MSALPRFSPGLGLAAPLAGLAMAQSVQAVDYFLKIDGIEGEATDKDHKEWIDILSWSWGETCDPTAGRQHKPLTITKELDKSSPLLMLACATGDTGGGAIGEIILSVADPERNEGAPYMKVVFTEAVITSYDTSGSSATETTSESFSLNFEKITWTYTPRNGGDPVEVSYDVGTSSAE